MLLELIGSTTDADMGGWIADRDLSLCKSAEGWRYPSSFSERYVSLSKIYFLISFVLVLRVVFVVLKTRRYGDIQSYPRVEEVPEAQGRLYPNFVRGIQNPKVVQNTKLFYPS